MPGPRFLHRLFTLVRLHEAEDLCAPIFSGAYVLLTGQQRENDTWAGRGGERWKSRGGGGGGSGGRAAWEPPESLTRFSGWRRDQSPTGMRRSSKNESNPKAALPHREQFLIRPPGEKSHHHGRDKHNLARASRFPADGHAALSSPFMVEICFLTAELSIQAGIDQSLL